MTGNRLRAVLVGCGRMSATWLNAARDIEGLELVALVDIQEVAARQRAEHYELAAAVIGTELAPVLEQTAPDIVFDCTLPEAHHDVTLTALRSGCHVLGEKPLADTLEHAREMVAVAQDTGKIYAVIQNRRYDPNIRRLRAFLESGTIGRLTTITSDFFIGAHFGGFRDRMQHVLLLDMAIHTFDAARLLTGADAVSVYCKEWNPVGSWYDHDGAAMALFELSDGIIYSYRGSWCAEGLNTAWEGEWRIVGERGSVRWDGATGFEAQVVAETGGFRSVYRDVELPDIDDVKVGGHAGIMREFVHAVRTGSVPETVCTDNIKSLAMVFGAIESAELGKDVAIEPENRR